MKKFAVDDYNIKFKKDKANKILEGNNTTDNLEQRNNQNGIKERSRVDYERIQKRIRKTGTENNVEQREGIGIKDLDDKIKGKKATLFV